MDTSSFKRVAFFGDVHGYHRIWGGAKRIAEHFRADAFIICGDFGWWTDDHPGAREFENDSGIPCFWIDGNHENFDDLYAKFDYTLLQPQETQENVFWLPRGTVMDVGRYKTMFFGGGTSVDKMYRVEHESWWSQEKIIKGEIERANDNWMVKGTIEGPRMLVTHELPAWIYDQCPELVNQTKVNDPNSAHDRALLDNLLFTVDPDVHFHGHWHIYHDSVIKHPNFSSNLDYVPRTFQSIGLDCEPTRNFFIKDVS